MISDKTQSVVNDYSAQSFSGLRPAVAPEILKHAAVPEHSVLFMRAVSGGEPFLCEDYLFFAEDDWLLAIGYPLSGAYDPSAFSNAIKNARAITKAWHCWAVCPQVPEFLVPNRVEEDVFFILESSSRPAPRLLRVTDRAEQSLSIELGKDFTAKHQVLWDQFLKEKTLSPRVFNLYSRTSTALKRTPDLALLNAWDRKGNLAACLLLDLAPQKFLSYILGAHCKLHYTPYSTDLLFREMLFLARKLNKEYIHLGIGVNHGIRRFKTKWGGKPHLNYQLAEWTAETRSESRLFHIELLQNKSSYFNSLPQQRKFKMLWEVRKKGNTSWIGGSAHFFRYSFRHHFRKLFDHVQTVIFEGPLDRASMAFVAGLGKAPDTESAVVIDHMQEDEVRSLERVVQGPKGFWADLLGMSEPQAPDVRYYLSRTRPWMALFSLWSGFLRRMDWKQSVDMEAWELAKEMDKHVLAMETIQEQVQTLESIPLERIVRFFRNCGKWRKMARQNERAYLKGDLEGLFGTSAEFPSRTEKVINLRDQLFLERMTPYLEQGSCMVFVGSAHMFNLRGMLQQAGYELRKMS